LVAKLIQMFGAAGADAVLAQGGRAVISYQEG
jgi:hypothetical protein